MQWLKVFALWKRVQSERIKPNCTNAPNSVVGLKKLGGQADAIFRRTPKIPTEKITSAQNFNCVFRFPQNASF